MDRKTMISSISYIVPQNYSETDDCPKPYILHQVYIPSQDLDLLLRHPDTGLGVDWVFGPLMSLGICCLTMQRIHQY